MANQNVLLIDDEELIRTLLKQVLTEEGFRVTTAENGQVGLEKLETMRRPGVIVLDLMMPVLNGWDFLSRIRSDQRFREIPVIVTSASGSEKPPGATSILPKPYGFGRLLQAVQSTLPSAPFFRRP